MRPLLFSAPLASALLIAATPAFSQTSGGFLGSGVLQIVAGVALLLLVIYFGMYHGFNLSSKHRNRYGVEEYRDAKAFVNHHFAKGLFYALVFLGALTSVLLILWGLMI